MSQVLGLKTSREVWASLENAFAQQSQARVMHQLQSLKKGSMSVQDYLQTIKSLADSLSAINQPVSDPDLVLYALGGKRSFLSA